MSYSQSAPTSTRRIPRLLVAGLLVASAAGGGLLGYQLQTFSASAAASPINALRSEHPAAEPAIGPVLPQVRALRDRGLALLRDPHRLLQPPGPPPLGSPARSPGAAAPGPSDAADPGRPGTAPPGGSAPRNGPQRGAVGAAEGVVPDGTTVYDDEIPAIARLDPALLGALRRAATDAAKNGVKLYVTSGWRSPTYQNRLLREAVAEYGSEQEAARWVATADTSPHVSGDAVDVGPADATAWLSRYGARYGLCQIYGNEPWHFELRPDAIRQSCPPMYADPTQDPRMQQ